VSISSRLVYGISPADQSNPFTFCWLRCCCLRAPLSNSFMLYGGLKYKKIRYNSSSRNNRQLLNENLFVVTKYILKIYYNA